MVLAVSLTSTVTCKRTSLPGCRRPLRVQSRASSNGPEAPRPESNLLQQMKTGATHFSQVIATHEQQRFDTLSNRYKIS